MSQKQINVSSDVKELIIREGEAAPIVQTKQIVIVGNAKAVSSFLSARTNDLPGVGLQKFDRENAIALVDYEKGTVVLKLNPSDPFGTEITSKVQLAPEFEAFHINQNKMWSRVELVQFLKFQKRWFAQPEQHEALLTAYMKLQIEVNTNINQGHDDRGNRDIQLKKAVKSQNIPEKFRLNIPLFKGMESRSFWVDICLDTSESNVKFWFESVEADEMIQIERKKLLDKELEACKGIPVIVL